MLTCKDISALATEHSEGCLSASEREGFEAHVAACAGCSAFVKQLAMTSRVLGALPEPELPLALRQELMARFDAWALRRQGAPSPAAKPDGRARVRRLSPAPAVAALGMFGVLLVVSRHPSRQPGDWGVALALAGLAAALALLLPRLTFGFSAAAVAAALGAALLAGGQGALELDHALRCVLTVGAAAAGTTGVAWIALRRGPGALLSEAVGAWAVAGALAGVGALQVTCGAHTSVSHHLAFHLGSLLVVAALASLLPRLGTRAA